MKKFKDLAIKYKILFGYFLILAMFVALGGYYAYSTNAIKRASRNIELSNFAGVELISSMQLTLYRITYLTQDIANWQGKPEWQGYQKEIKMYSRKFRQLLSEYKGLVKGKPDILRKVSDTESIFKQHQDLIDKKIAAELKGVILEHHEEDLEQIKKNLEELHDEDTSNLSSALGSIDHLAGTTRDSYLWLILLSLVLSVIIACAIARVIALPIKGLMIGMRKLTNGSPDYKIQITSKDEIGSLQVGFINMAERLRQSHRELENRVKERTRDLEKSQRYMQRITDGIKEGIMLLSADFKILWANSMILKAYNISLKDIQGKFCYKITHRVDAPCSSAEEACPLRESIMGKRDAKELHIHQDSSGKKTFVEVTCYPILDAEGQPGEIIHISRDITDEVEAKEKIKTYVEELERTKVKLTTQLRELESFSKVAVDREIKMIELKKKIKDMETRA